MSMSKKLTFSLASLVVIFALAAMPAMAQTLSAEWTTDVDTTNADTPEPGWNAILTYATAPAATVGLPSFTSSGGNTVGTYDPATPDGTVTAFKFNVEPNIDGADVDIISTGFRRITLKNARDLAATSIARPKLKSITAPEATNKFFEAVILFEAPAAAVAGPPAVAEIGPSDGLTEDDLTVTNSGILSFTANSASMYTVVINPTGSTPVTVALDAAFPHQTAEQTTDATASIIYDIIAPVRGTANTTTDGPDTIPVNNRKPPKPDSGQWGPGDFDFIFSLTDEGSDIRSSSISLEDNQSSNVLSFSNIGRTTVDGQFAATVSTNNVDIEAGTIVTVLVTVSDMAGNETTFPVGTITLAAKTGGADATFTSATPASAGSVGQGGTIALVFSTDPGAVTVVPAAISEAGTGTARTLTIPAEQAVGALSITLTWGTSGSQMLTYTVTEAQPTVDVTVPPESYVIVARSMTAPGLDGVTLPANESSAAGSMNPSITTWTGMPNLEDLLYRGGTVTLTITKALDTALFDNDADGADATTGKLTDGTTDGTKPRQYAALDLIITEVMAAINEAVPGTAAETAGQWIEIYNPNKAAITATLTTKRGFPALGAAMTDVLLDRLSNVVSGGWTFDNLGENGFDDSDPMTGDLPNREFVSFYRKERGKDGETKTHWATSTELYFKGYRGTPGDSRRTAVGLVVTTSFDVGDIVFNEISNRSSGSYEWIELRNKSVDTPFNLKNRQISIVTAVDSDTWLFRFGDKNLNVAAEGILLLTASDPSGDSAHPLAAGWNVEKNAANQVNGVSDKSPSYLILEDSADEKRTYNEDALDNTAGLPDDGEFVLILRSRTHADDVGKDTNIIDIAGYSTKLKVGAATAAFTNLWPLKGGVQDAQHDHNKLAVNEVHRRQKGDIWGTSATRRDRTHVDDAAFRNIGWKSVGYKRNAAATATNGGTPGYDNGAVKGADLVADTVLISEVMYDITGRRPQWIELFNTSHTFGVDINNWSIFVVNHSVLPDGTDYENDEGLSERIDLDGKIPPRQTFLIVSTGGSDGTNLPSERVHNLRRGRGMTLLNPNGFYLTLKAKTNEGDAAKHQTVDIAGNLVDPSTLTSRRADAQSFEVLEWALPSGENDSGDRVSIARRTDGTLAAMGTATNPWGTMAAAWISSDLDPRQDTLQGKTYYGHPTDVSSPGLTIGGVLPVSLSKFRPERMKDTGEIVVRWITESELNNAGFNILRSETRNGEFTKLNTKLIAGQGTTSERTVYSFPDTSAKPNVVYYYQIQDVSLDGQVQTLRTTHLRGNVTAAGKLTTTWGELKLQD